MWLLTYLALLLGAAWIWLKSLTLWPTRLDSEFSEAAVLKFVDELSSLGPHEVGSYENEAIAPLKVLEDILAPFNSSDWFSYNYQIVSGPKARCTCPGPTLGAFLKDYSHTWCLQTDAKEIIATQSAPQPEGAPCPEPSAVLLITAAFRYALYGRSHLQLEPAICTEEIFIEACISPISVANSIPTSSDTSELTAVSVRRLIIPGSNIGPTTSSGAAMDVSFGNRYSGKFPFFMQMVGHLVNAYRNVANLSVRISPMSVTYYHPSPFLNSSSVSDAAVPLLPHNVPAISSDKDMNEFLDAVKPHLVAALKRKNNESWQQVAEAFETELPKLVNYESQSVGSHWPLWKDAVLSFSHKMAQPGTSPPTLMLASHYDSANRSPGAADAGACVGIINEVARVTLRSILTGTEQKFLYPLVLNLNGAEETLLQAAHGFLSHPWFDRVGAFVNLEAAGAGGKEFLLQSSSLPLLRSYKKYTARPHAASVAQDTFDKGLVPGITDYSVYNGMGGKAGLDVAWGSEGWRYHTSRDDIYGIQRGSIQRYGVNILGLTFGILQDEVGLPAMVHNATTHFDGRSTQPPPSPSAKMAYFDFLGTYFAIFPSQLFDLAVLLWCIMIVAESRTIKIPLRRMAVAVSLAAFVMTIGVLAAGVLCATVGGLLKTAGRSMLWYSQLWIAFALYSPSAIGCLVFTAENLWPYMTKTFATPAVRSPSVVGLFFSHGFLLLAGIIASVLQFLGFRAFYLPACALLFGTLGRLGNLTFLRLRPAVWKKMGHDYFSLTSTVWQAISLSPVLLLGLCTSLCVLDHLLPTFGRVSLQGATEIVVATTVSVVSCLCFLGLLPQSLAALPPNKRQVFSWAAACSVVLIAYAVAVAQPFTEMAPKRFDVVHYLREVHGIGGNYTSDTGILLQATHDHGVLDEDKIHIRRAIQQGFEESDVAEFRKKQLGGFERFHCAGPECVLGVPHGAAPRPTVHLNQLYAIRRWSDGSFIPSPFEDSVRRNRPHYFGSDANVASRRYEWNPRINTKDGRAVGKTIVDWKINCEAGNPRARLHIGITGERFVLLIPKKGVENWSLSKVLPPARKDCDCHVVFFADGSDPQPWPMWLDITRGVSDTRDEVFEFTVASLALNVNTVVTDATYDHHAFLNLRRRTERVEPLTLPSKYTCTSSAAQLATYKVQCDL